MSLTDHLAAVEAADDLDWALFVDVCNAVLPPMQTNDDVAFKARLIELIGVKAWESAALALCERVLPGWKWSVTFGYADSDGGPYYARVNQGHTAIYHEPTPGPHPALALLAALLKAKIAEVRA